MPPVDEEFYGEPIAREFDIWVAQTKYGAPRIIFGLADTEEIFWEKIRSESGPSSLNKLGPITPATNCRVYYLTEMDLLG